MASLAVADLLVTAILVPMRAAQHLAFYNGDAIQEPAVHVLGFIGRITILASISSLAALSNDRRVALKHPLKYRSVMRYAKGRTLKILLTIWVFSLFFTSVPLIPGVEDEVFLIGFTSFVVVVTTVVLFFLVRQSARWRITATNSYYTKGNAPHNSFNDGRANRSDDSQLFELKTMQGD